MVAFVDAPLREALRAVSLSEGGSVRVHQHRRQTNHFFHNRWETEIMDGSFQLEQTKPGDTAPNGVASQREIPAFSVVQLHMLDAHVIERCTLAGAFNECLRHDGRSDEEIGNAIHVSKGYMSKLLRGLWVKLIRRLIAFTLETRCVAVWQKAVDELGYELKPKKSELERRADAAEAEAAALRARLEAERRVA